MNRYERHIAELATSRSHEATEVGGQDAPRRITRQDVLLMEDDVELSICTLLGNHEIDSDARDLVNKKLACRKQLGMLARMF